MGVEDEGKQEVKDRGRERLCVAVAPRPVRHTLEVALAYGLQLDTEARHLWLADLAVSLPMPAGWTRLEHPEMLGMAFWHNTLTNTSQWVHPIDDYIKGTIKMLRAPSSPTEPRSASNASRRSSRQTTSVSATTL